MKALFRSRFVQGALARLFAAWLTFCFATTRWRVENREVVERVWGEGGGVIVCFWHSRIALAPRSWDLKRAQSPRAMISLSPDGEFIAQAVERIGFPAVRGSSSKKSAPDKAKGGAQAFRDGLRWIKGGNCLALTPDGPRGPAETMAEGAVMLAKASGAPVLLLGAAARPRLVLDTWDRGIVPLPFGRGVFVWERVEAGRDADPAELQARWAERLTAVTLQAEQLAERGA